MISLERVKFGVSVQVEGRSFRLSVRGNPSPSATPPAARAMCWNVEFSLGSALVAWVACAYMWRRDYSPRDRWYALYLLTYTFTQVVDVALWLMHEQHAPLAACPAYRLQWAAAPAGDQYPQYVLSKYVVPLVVLSQHYVQLHYPSDRLRSWRGALIGVHAAACAAMSFQFACTDLVRSAFPAPHDTLRWGAYSAETWHVLVVTAVVCLDFALIVPERRVLAAQLGVFLAVVGTLWATEGTLALGSKWCTYCLVFTAVYTTDPWWGPGPGARRAGKAAASVRLQVAYSSPRKPKAA
jgi:hypothetical protein